MHKKNTVVKQKTVGYYTLGCKLNYAETDAIARTMEAEGYTRVKFSESADYYVINTCSVTEAANKKSRYMIRKAYSRSPKATIIIVGCYAQLKPEEIQKIAGVSLVLGAFDKFNIPAKIREYETSGSQQLLSSCEISEVSLFQGSYSLEERTRSFLKVQDGCDYNCSYCTIPKARGKSRNASVLQLVNQAHKIARAGVKEIVLTGINIGDFGRTTGESLLELLQQLDTIEGIERIRISSIEPNLLSSEIIQFVAQSRACMPHFHIPLQAGSNGVLKLMRRRYTTELFTSKINEILHYIPHAAIGVDVIVGTPGETDELFEQSYQYIASLPISYLHVFTYSERDNTDALHIEPKTPLHIRHTRSIALHELSEQLHVQYAARYSATVRPVLFESKQKNGMLTGYTDTYIKVSARISESYKNAILPVRLEYTKDGMKGEVI